jgi:hypothetical protein
MVLARTWPTLGALRTRKNPAPVRGRRTPSRFARAVHRPRPRTGSALRASAARSQRWSAARANRRPPATRLAPANARTPIFAAEDAFVWSCLEPLRERGLSRETALRSVRGSAGVCRRVVVAPRVLLAEPVGRFGPPVVALRVPRPEPASLAGLDPLRERAELGVLAVLDFARLDLPPEFLAVAGALLPGLGVLAEDSDAPPGLFGPRRPAPGFLRVDVGVERLRVAVRLSSLAGTSVMSTSPSSDTGRSGTRRPSSPGPSAPSCAS